MKAEGVYQWSHQHLSSKIKEIQVLVHSEGHVRDIHARYEKGEPKKYDQAGRFEVLTCGEGEYIKSIEGGFWEGYLQYLTIKTNNHRVASYGNWEELQNHS